eukprot:364494-Chlamydomonas_euryale.AAC.12
MALVRTLALRRGWPAAPGWARPRSRRPPCWSPGCAAPRQAPPATTPAARARAPTRPRQTCASSSV